MRRPWTPTLRQSPRTRSICRCGRNPRVGKVGNVILRKPHGFRSAEGDGRSVLWSLCSLWPSWSTDNGTNVGRRIAELANHFGHKEHKGRKGRGAAAALITSVFIHVHPVVPHWALAAPT